MKKWLLFAVVILGAIFVIVHVTSGIKTTNTSITIKGSDTEVQMVSMLAEAFAKDNPDAKISVTGGGSGVGLAALLNKEIDIANSSRKMKDDELQQAKDKNLYVQEFIVARDGLAVIVHPDNAITQLTIDQLGKIYKGAMKNWKEVGGQDTQITLYGRQSTSGTYTFFRDTVIKDDYAPSMRNMEGSQAIVDGVISDATGIGYVGVGYVKDTNGQPRKEIKIISIATDDKTSPVSPIDVQAVKQGEYPIFRPIYQYLPNTPQRDSFIAKFLQFEHSEQGQAIVEKAGFYSITQEDAAQNLQLLQKIQQ